MKRFLLAGAVALALSACATTPAGHLSEGKALADTWSAFDAASVTLDALAKAGSLSASEKAVVRADAPRVRDALNAATAAYQTNNDASVQQNVATASSLIAQLGTIAGAHK
jgi:hypothetical protein